MVTDSTDHGRTQGEIRANIVIAERWSFLPAASRAALLLAGLGATLTIGAFLVANTNSLPSIVRDNAIAWPTRRSLVVALACTATLLGAIPFCALLFRPERVELVESIARRLSPLMPVSFIPALSHWEIWASRPLAHLVFVTLLMLAVHKAVLVASAEPPIVRWWPSEEALAVFAGSRLARIVPLIVVILAAIGYASYFSFYTVQAHQFGHTSAYDLGIFDNLHWQILHGDGFMRSTPGMGPILSHFGRHATMLAFLFAPIYALHESATTLLVLQASLIAGAAIPLYFFAARHTTRAAACLLALIYLSYAPSHGANSYDFHYLSTAPFFIFALALAIDVGRTWAIVLATILTLACREDVAIAVAILGAYHVLGGTKPRLGLALVLVGGLYFALVKFVLMPAFEGGSSYADIYRDLIPEGGQGFGGVITTIVSNPSYTFATIPYEGKIVYALQMLVPLAFLPLRRPMGLLFCLPGIVFTLLSSNFEPHLKLSFQYTAFWTPYVFVAAALFLEARPAQGVREAAHARMALLCALALGGWATSYQWGGLFQQRTMGSAFSDHFMFEPDEARRHLPRDRDAILRHLPASASVEAGEMVVSHVSNREFAFSLGRGIHDADYALYERISLNQPQRVVLADELLSGVMGLEAENESYVLLRRGAPTVSNPRLFREVARRPMPRVDSIRLQGLNSEGLR